MDKKAEMMGTIAEMIKGFCRETGFHYYSEYQTGTRWCEPCVAVATSGNPLNMLISLSDYIHKNYTVDSVSPLLGNIRMDQDFGNCTVIYFPCVKEN